jgi:hypothetical protein
MKKINYEKIRKMIEDAGYINCLDDIFLLLAHNGISGKMAEEFIHVAWITNSERGWTFTLYANSATDFLIYNMIREVKNAKKRKP